MGTSRSGRYLSTKGSRTSVSEYARVHSDEGTFKNVGSKDPKSPFRMESGGHGEANLRLLRKYGIKYEISKTFPNGVRVGIVDNHKDRGKRYFYQQAWFPPSWTAKDIRRAGEHVASLQCNRKVNDGGIMFGTWKNVRVGVIKTKGKVATICPDYRKQPKPKKKGQQHV